jgi:hypothetical protein
LIDVHFHKSMFSPGFVFSVFSNFFFLEVVDEQIKLTIMKILSIALATALLSSCLISCKKDNDATVSPLPSQTPAPVITKPNTVFYGLTNDNRIIRYNANAVENAGNAISITGLQAGENLLSIDFRPATGQLYALGSSSRLYTINLTTGAATAQGTAAFSPALNTNIASIDFNPTVDRVRLVTAAGQNLRLNPETGSVVAIDLPINGIANPTVHAIAYTNSFAGATSTELFDIDFTFKKLYKQTPPNEGGLVEVASIDVPFDGKSGFDINPDNTVALVSLPIAGVTKLYGINISNAATTLYGDFAGTIVDIAIPTNSVAYSTTNANMLQIFNPLSLGTPLTRNITGLTAGENILGIDMRPLNGQLYALAANGTGAAKLYTINLSSGVANTLGSSFSIGNGVTAIGFDFNPTVDRIRLVTNTGVNLRLNPIDGSLAATDAPLNPGSPAITGAAYTNNFAGTTSTNLFVLNGTTLFNQTPPNAGTLVTVGSLGITNGSSNGFDIGGTSNVAYAIFTVGTSTKLYTINTTTGSAVAGADFPNAVTGLAIGLGF